VINISCTSSSNQSFFHSCS